MAERIRFSIDESGEVHVSVEGATGRSCEELTAPFEAALGVVAQREYKDSYFTEADTTAEATTETGAA